MPINPSREKLSRILLTGSGLLLWTTLQAFSARAAPCSGGSCSPNSGSAPSSVTVASVSPGRSFTGGSNKNMERDWRTRLMLDNVAEENWMEEEESAGVLAPIVGRQDGEPGSLQLTYSANYRESRYPPYADGRESNDREHSYEFAVEALYTVGEETELLGQMSFRHEWSQDDPEAFRHYEVDVFQFSGGVRQAFGENFTGTLRLGGYAVDGGGTGFPDDGPPNPEWLASLELEYGDENFTLRGGTYRSAFPSPDMQGYKLARLYLNYLDANLRPFEKLNLNLRGSDLRFSDDTENYQSLGGIVTFYPSLKRHLGFSAGATREFRKTDETILTAGVEWMHLLSARNSFFTSARFNANTQTDEREITAELVFGRLSESRKHGAAVGLSLQYEFNVYDHYSTILFIRFY